MEIPIATSSVVSLRSKVIRKAKVGVDGTQSFLIIFIAFSEKGRKWVQY